MEEQTTTEPVEQTTGGSIHGVAVDTEGRALPEPEGTTEEAGSQTSEPVQEEKSEGTGEIDNQPSQDDLTKWAANKGIEVTTDAERKLAEMARNSEKAMHTKASEVSQLQKAVVPEPSVNEPGYDALAQEVQQMRLEQNVRNFYQDHPDAKEMDGQLAELVEKRPHLAGDLEALYAVAKLDNLNQQTDAIKKDGGREALENLAGKQRAAVPVASATSGRVDANRITAENVDRLIAQNGHSWYMDNVKEINAVLEQ